MDLKTWHRLREENRLARRPRKLSDSTEIHCARGCFWVSATGVCQRALAPNYGSYVKSSIGCSEHPGLKEKAP